MQDMGIRILFQGKNLSRLFDGLLVTLKIAVISIVISLILGIILGIIMTSKNIVVRAICRIYLEVIRIIPILAWLFFFYYLLTQALNIHLDSVVVAILVFTMWGTGEMGDIVRGAITSMPKHQSDSGKAIGLTTLQIYRYIIIPQAIRRMVPSAMNLATRMIKTTSLVSLISIVEVIKVGTQIIEYSSTKNPSVTIWIYGLIFVLYFIICYPISILSKRLEAKWQS